MHFCGDPIASPFAPPLGLRQAALHTFMLKLTAADAHL